VRVVFDSSAFQPEQFQILRNSELIRHVRARRITPIYGPIFLEEVVRTYGVRGKRKELIESWVPFIEKTANRFINELGPILQQELVQGRGVKTNVFMPLPVQKFILRKFTAIPEGDSWDMWRLSELDRDIANQKRNNTHEIVKSIRNEMNEWRRKTNPQGRAAVPPPFEVFLKKELENAGRVFLPRLIKARYPDAVADRWAKKPQDYPYFSNYVRNMLYLGFHAMTKPNEKLDRNAQADLDIMLNLQYGDILVSEEAGYLKTAFNDLWAPQGKTLLTVDQFARIAS